jgi:DNA-binding response OmpR family regulator
MTVTPLPTRPSARRRPRTTAPAALAPAALAPAEPALTVSFDVTLTGEDRHAAAVEVLETLRALTDRLDAARVAVTPARPVLTAVVDDARLIDEDVLRILPESRTVLRGGETIALSRLEFELLLFLADNPRRVFTRLQLLHSVWGHRHTGERTVDVHIRRLRAKVGTPFVTTLRGVGYRLAEDAKVVVVRFR